VEPVGALMMLVYGYGWGEPVETNTAYFHDRKRGAIITYGAPILISILCGCIAAILLLVVKIVARNANWTLPLSYNGWSLAVSMLRISGWKITQGFSGHTIVFLLSGALYQIVYLFARSSLAVALFNIIPVYPLDGKQILSALLSPRSQMSFEANSGLIQMVWIFLLLLNVINGIFDPIVNSILAFAR
jgi:Zn-dependent protease